MMILFLYVCLLLVITHHADRRKLMRKPRVVRVGNNPGMYAIDENGIRHAFPDWNTFISLGYTNKDINIISKREFDYYDPGEDIKPYAVPESSKCPCSNVPLMLPFTFINSGAKSLKHSICMINNKYSQKFLKMYEFYTSNDTAANETDAAPFKLSIIKSSYQALFKNDKLDLAEELDKCDIILELGLKVQKMKLQCPEYCLPLPYVYLPFKHMKSIMKTNSIGNTVDFISLTCTLPITTIRATWKQHIANYRHIMDYLLHQVIIRRLEECHEPQSWSTVIMEHRTDSLHKNISMLPNNTHIPTKFQVFGLILWVGSLSRMSLMEEQMSILNLQVEEPKVSADDDDTFQDTSGSSDQPDNYLVAGWIGTEAQYNCRQGSTKCLGQTKLRGYHPHMPETAINGATFGWACAQRRPLRAVAHAMMLYDSFYMLLVDDDSYVNMKILNSLNFRQFITSQFMFKNEVYGELHDPGRISNFGLWFGGGGYLLSKATISKLNAYYLPAPREQRNKHISPQQMRHLSLHWQALQVQQENCQQKEYEYCIVNAEQPQLHADLSIRLVDLCLRMFSDEFTCYHSDHAITRCLIYATYSYPMDVPCAGKPIKSRDFTFGMCYETPECNPDIHLVCHRYKANVSDPYQPLPTGLKSALHDS